jgi:hypothetical protein
MLNSFNTKGAIAEELVRQYFLRNKYFVVRGIKYRFKAYEVTDIDLFIYSSISNIQKERINIDIKNKKSPQAIERILWTRGLQSILGTNKCIVVTTEARQDIVEFGNINRVVVLDGNFLTSLKGNQDINNNIANRISEEDLFNLLTNYDKNNPSKKSIRKQYDSLKSLLLTKSNFDGINEYLDEINTYIRIICQGNSSDTLLRFLFILISYFLLLLDYSLRNTLNLDHDKLKDFIFSNIKYGTNQERTLKLVELIKDYSSIDKRYKDIHLSLLSALDDKEKNYMYEVLSDFFSIPENLNSIFQNSIEFESIAYDRNPIEIYNLPSSIKSIIYLLMDSMKIERTLFV